MKYYLWLNGKQDGPFDAAQIREMVKSDTITSSTLCVPENGGNDWKPVEQVVDLVVASETLKSDKPPKLVATATESTSFQITQRSGWSLAMNILGCVAILGGMAGCASDNRAGLISFAVGLGAGINCFFFAFLVDVFTDARWYLKQIADKSGVLDRRFQIRCPACSEVGLVPESAIGSQVKCSKCAGLIQVNAPRA